MANCLKRDLSQSYCSKTTPASAFVLIKSMNIVALIVLRRHVPKNIYTVEVLLFSCIRIYNLLSLSDL